MDDSNSNLQKFSFSIDFLPEGAEPFVIEQTAAGKPTVQYISLFVVQ